MKKLIKKLEDIMVAVTFAEAGEMDEVYRIMGEDCDQEAITRTINEKTALDRARK